MSHSARSSDGSPSPEEQRAIDLRYSPPENEMPGAIAFSAVLANLGGVAIAITGARAYSAGISLDIAIRVRRRVEVENRNVLHDVLFAGRRYGNTADALLLGVEYPDGRRASILDEPWIPGSSERTDQPVLAPGGGGGSSTSQELTFWLSPLPPPGDLILVAAWPALGIAETQVVIAADLIAAGVAGIVELWLWEPPADDDEQMPPPRPILAPGSWFADQPE
jgi:hypothetical protein